MKKILLPVIVVVLTVTFILSKDFLAEKIIVYYLRNRYQVNCGIRDLQWGFKGISARGIRLSNSYLDAESERLDIFYQGGGLGLRNWRVTGDMSLNIEEVPPFSDTGAGPLFLESLTISDFLLEVTIRETGKIKAEVKAGLDLRRRGMNRIKDLRIKDLKARYGGITLERAGIEKTGHNKYLVRINDMVFGKNKTGDIVMPFLIRDQEVLITGTEQGVFGDAARVKGMFSPGEKERRCLTVEFEKCSFSCPVNFLAGEEVSLNGLFEGVILLCQGTEQGLSAEGELRSSGGGILIEKEASLDFLKDRLDALSYKSLIDNFRDYNYNRGEIIIKTMVNIISIGMKFDSDKMGSRDITVNFYKNRGGNYEYP